MELTAPRRSEILQALLAKQLRPRNDIINPGQLAAELGAQLIRKKRIDKLQEEEAQEERASSRRIADVLAGQSGRQLIDIESVDGPAETLAVSDKRGAEGELRQQSRIAALRPEELQMAQLLAQGQRELADPTAFEQKRIMQEDAQAHDETMLGSSTEAKRDADAREFAQRDKELLAKLNAEEKAQTREIWHEQRMFEKKIEAEIAAAGSGGVKMTDNQRVSAGYAARMDQANSVIDEIGENFAGFFDFGKHAPTSVQTADRQRFEQAKRNFINAVLRRESGAVISEQEFENADKQYFPQRNDSKEVLDQKAENRRIATESMRLNGGPAYEVLRGRLEQGDGGSDEERLAGLGL